MRWPTLTEPRRPWLAHLGVWALGGLVYFLAVLPFYGGPPLKMLAFKGGWTVVGWGIAEGLARVYRRLGVGRATLGRAAVQVTLVSALVALGWVALMGGISILIQGNTLLFFTPSFMPFVVMNHVFILMAWSGGYLALTFWRRSQVEERRVLAAESAARAAQIELLRLQMNPHFLFNAMASLRALIAEDPARARGMVTELSAFLRYALAAEDRTWVSVSEELEMLRLYLEIERIRFGERLDASVEGADGAGDVAIPGLLLLSLVENAIKHGEHDDGRLRIRVRARTSHDGLVLTVANSGRLSTPAHRTSGFGLRNVGERLASAFPGRSTLRLEEADGEVVATIRILAPEGSDGT